MKITASSKAIPARLHNNRIGAVQGAQLQVSAPAQSVSSVCAHHQQLIESDKHTFNQTRVC